jgi:hypothetical protein
MKRHLIILILVLVSKQLFSQITSDRLIREYLSGKLFIFNNYAVNSADSAFFKKLIEGKILKIDSLDNKTGLTEFGTIGASGVFRIQVLNLNVLKDEQYRVVDCSILKYFVDEKKTFYYIDGLPNKNTVVALNGLINKKIKEIRQMGSNEAQAIWGNEGKNGAIVINTDGQIVVPMK